MTVNEETNEPAAVDLSSCISRRDLIERATKLGIMGVSGGLLVHDVASGMAQLRRVVV